jgi:hypothetical protein
MAEMKVHPFPAVTSLVVFLVLGGCSGGEPDRTRADSRPDILLLVVDTLRADRLQCYDPSSRPTPHLDELANTSYRFASAVAQAPCTKPSMWNIVTSRYQAPVPLPEVESPTTMATHFKSLGYRTAAFLNKTKLGQDPGLAHDFDVFPTIAEIVGGLPQGDLEGKSLLPLIDGRPTAVASEPVAACLWQNSDLVVFGGYALETGAFGSSLRSLATGDPVTDRADLELRLHEARATIPHDPGGKAAEAREEMIEWMRAIG